MTTTTAPAATIARPSEEIACGDCGQQGDDVRLTDCCGTYRCACLTFDAECPCDSDRRIECVDCSTPPSGECGLCSDGRG